MKSLSRKQQMKTGLVKSFVNGVNDYKNGETYSTIIRYFLPELVTTFLLNSLPWVIDCFFIGCLASTPSFAAAGANKTLFNLLTKMAESFMIGTVILAGQFNGAREFTKAGKSLKNSFWVTAIIGALLALILYFGSYIMYYFIGMPQDVLSAGIRYVQLRAIGVFLTFIYFSFAGFLRGIKDTKTPMLIFIAGSIAFVIFDYLFIFGAGPIEPMGLTGSALAVIIQYGIMALLGGAYVLFSKETRIYAIDLFTLPDMGYIKEFISLSWPVMIDKSILALSYVVLLKHLTPLGTNVLAGFNAVSGMEHFSFLPALAFAQITSLLVSNDVGSRRWNGIKNNIKKILFMSVCFVFSILAVLSVFSRPIVHFLDKQNDFTIFVVHVFPVISILIFFDLMQVILAAALRGAAQVRVVMATRIVFLFYFIVASSLISNIQMRHDIKFIMLYSSFYVGSLLMSIFYVYWFRSGKWKTQVEVQDD